MMCVRILESRQHAIQIAHPTSAHKESILTQSTKSISCFVRFKCEEIFGIDLRSLALLRVGLALLVIIDLVQRSFDLKAHYTDLGILPRWALTHDLGDICECLVAQSERHFRTRSRRVRLHQELSQRKS